MSAALSASDYFEIFRINFEIELNHCHVPQYKFYCKKCLCCQLLQMKPATMSPGYKTCLPWSKMVEVVLCYWNLFYLGLLVNHWFQKFFATVEIWKYWEVLLFRDKQVLAPRQVSNQFSRKLTYFMECELLEGFVAVYGLVVEQ